MNHPPLPKNQCVASTYGPLLKYVGCLYCIFVYLLTWILCYAVPRMTPVLGQSNSEPWDFSDSEDEEPPTEDREKAQQGQRMPMFDGSIAARLVPAAPKTLLAILRSE